MNVAPLISGATALSCIGGAAFACSYDFTKTPPAEIRKQSKRVAVDRQCRTINVGVWDNYSLGGATDLGNGRVQQVVNDDKSMVVLADCNTREATMLRGTATQIGETSCGPIYEYASVTGPKAIVALNQGETLNDLVEIVDVAGVTELNPVEQFFTFTDFPHSNRYDVSRKDKFNLLCGCDVYYPNSPGASK